MFTAHLSNCPIAGEDITRYGDGSWSRNVIHLKLGRWRIRLVQARELASGQLRAHIGEKLVATRAEITPANLRSLAAMQRVAEDVSWLLSLATLSPVRFTGWKYGGRGATWQTQGVLNYFQPTIDARNGAVVRQFLQATWAKYRLLKRRRRLPVVIDYLVQAEAPEQPVELQALLAFGALECLKSSYASSQRIPFRKGYFRKANGRHYNFEELATAMLAEQSMRKRLRRLIRLRNEIVHYGLARRGPEQADRAYAAVHSVIREYLLRLLGFKGHFIDYATGRNRSLSRGSA